MPGTLPRVLTASGLTKSFGPRQLFRDVSVRLLPRRRQALVGGNGMGKTTLLEILLGEQEPDAGEVYRPRELRIGYLPQDLQAERTGTVIDEAMAGATQVTEVAARLAELGGRLADTADPDHDRVLAAYGEAQTRFEQLGGYGLRAEAAKVLAGLGFSSDDLERPVGALSGGWRMRVALARLLVSQPDVLILDEPTNHLDVDSVAWLEQHLAGWGGALLFVSHDRDFIDAVATHVLELAGGTLTEYVGGFAEFVLAREAQLAEMEAAARQRSRQVAQAERFIERFRYKATKARQVQSRVKALERLAPVVVPDRRELVARFGFPEPQRSSRVVVSLEDVSVGYDDQEILSGVDLVIERGRKVALVGPNGAGKTTLVRLLLGQLSPTAGQLVMGSNVDAAYFAQDLAEQLDLGRTVVEEFKAKVGERSGRNLRTMLGSFGFSGDAGDRRVGDLSGGEKTRLALAEVLANPVNLAGAGRADQPSRPAQLRRAGGRPRRLPGHGRARDPRPSPDPRRGRRHRRGSQRDRALARRGGRGVVDAGFGRRHGGHDRCLGHRPGGGRRGADGGPGPRRWRRGRPPGRATAFRRQPTPTPQLGHPDPETAPREGGTGLGTGRA